MTKRIFVLFALPLLTVATVGVAQARSTEMGSATERAPHRALANEVAEGARCYSDPRCFMASF